MAVNPPKVLVCCGAHWPPHPCFKNAPSCLLPVVMPSGLWVPAEHEHERFGSRWHLLRKGLGKPARFPSGEREGQSLLAESHVVRGASGKERGAAHQRVDAPYGACY